MLLYANARVQIQGAQKKCDRVQIQDAQKMYDRFQQKLTAAKTVQIEYVSLAGNAWDQEHFYSYRKPNLFAVNGGINYTTDGIRTSENDDLGWFNRSARNGDVRTLPGFEALDPSVSKLRVANVQSKTLKSGMEVIALWFDIKPSPFWLYFDPGTRFPVEEQDGDEGKPPNGYDVKLDLKLDPNIFHVDHPLPMRKLLANLRNALNSNAPPLYRISEGKYLRGEAHDVKVLRLKTLLEDYPWQTALRSSRLVKLAQPTVYNSEFCYSLVVREDSEFVTCYVNSHTWLPSGYSILTHGQETGKFFHYSYRTGNGQPLRELSN